jgi:hypothetical protein
MMAERDKFKSRRSLVLKRIGKIKSATPRTG